MAASPCSLGTSHEYVVPSSSWPSFWPSPLALALALALARVLARTAPRCWRIEGDSAICGTQRGDTNAPASIWRSPVARSRASSCSLVASPTVPGSFCRPSRAPTSTIRTWLVPLVTSGDLEGAVPVPVPVPVVVSTAAEPGVPFGPAAAAAAAATAAAAWAAVQESGRRARARSWGGGGGGWCERERTTAGRVMSDEHNIGGAAAASARGRRSRQVIYTIAMWRLLAASWLSSA